MTSAPVLPDGWTLVALPSLGSTNDEAARLADAGAPEGNPKDLPPAPRFTDGWQIGQPDVVLSMSNEYNVPAEGTVNYQYFSVPTGFTEDKWIQAAEVRPGNRAVVHHVIVFVVGPDAARRRLGRSSISRRSHKEFWRRLGTTLLI